MDVIWDVIKWSGVVGGAALVLTALKPLLDRRYRAGWRYGAWLVMAVLLLQAPAQWEKLIPHADITPPLVIQVPQVEVSVSRQEGVAIRRPDGAAASAGQRDQGGTAQPRRRAAPMGDVLTGLWLAGMGLFGVYRLAGNWWFARRARRWSRPAGEDAQRVYDGVRREMGLKRVPPLLVSGAVDSPMVLGLLRPRLLLPGEEAEERDLAFILRHELTHYRRRDLLYKLVLLAANAMHWFNPLAYLLRREAERDLELTCDDAVMDGADAEARRAYSETLLSSIHRQKGLSRAALSSHFYGGKEIMKERFRNILGKGGRKWGGLALVLALAATVAAACALGVQPEEDTPLSEEELAQWQEKVESPEMDLYVWKMYTDRAYLPSMEKLDEIFPPPPEGVEELGHEDVNPRVISGTKNGDTVKLEIEGRFASRLPTGTLTLEKGEPVSFTTPLYTAAEAAARQLMEEMAERCTARDPELLFTEAYITNMFCSESLEIEGKTYYIWELYYRMKPSGADSAALAGDVVMENGWVTEAGGAPILIFSADEEGAAVLEGRIGSAEAAELGFSWEEYVYCTIHLGMENLRGILKDQPDFSAEDQEIIRAGYDIWATAPETVMMVYAHWVYGLDLDGDVMELRAFSGENPAVVVQAEFEGRTAAMLLVHVDLPPEAQTHRGWGWQVCGETWEPDWPEKLEAPEEAGSQAGPLSANELAEFADYFNAAARNGLLRFPYASLEQSWEYIDILFYDLGAAVTDEEERKAVADAFFEGELPDTDCSKLRVEFAREYLTQNFASSGNEEVERALVAMKRVNPYYLEDYGAWYMVHGDTMMSRYTFDQGERDEDGAVSLYYTADLWQYNGALELDMLWEQPMCARMLPGEDGGWGMLSNEIVSGYARG